VTDWTDRLRQAKWSLPKLAAELGTTSKHLRFALQTTEEGRRALDALRIVRPSGKGGKLAPGRARRPITQSKEAFAAQDAEAERLKMSWSEWVRERLKL
jgi:hypothetical protein